VLASGRDRAGHDLARGVVATHRVDGHHRPGAVGTRLLIRRRLLQKIRGQDRVVAGGQPGAVSASALACGQGGETETSTAARMALSFPPPDGFADHRRDPPA